MLCDSVLPVFKEADSVCYPARCRCVGLRDGDVGLDASVADVCLVIVFLESSSGRAGAHFEDEAQQADGAWRDLFLWRVSLIVVCLFVCCCVWLCRRLRS